MKKRQGVVVPMEGKRFGALLVLRRAPRTHRQADWVCRCDCGTECIKRGYMLRQNRIKSCGQAGCSWWAFKATPEPKLKPAEYQSWRHMHRRCTAKSGKHHRSYAGRGITVCERWKSFENFLADMGPKPTPKYTIDRINNNGNYEPGNCRWATPAEQSRNMRHNIYVEHDGERVLLMDVVERLGLKRMVVYGRLKNGWSLEAALGTPVRPKRKNSKRS